MRKVVFAGGIGVAIIALAAVYATRVDAQDRSRFNLQSAFLLGPGSSIGVTARDSEAGVVVKEVRADSPASRAGVKEGDVVTEFDGERARSAAQFSRLVRETAPGKTVKISVLRNGTAMAMDIAPETLDSNAIRFPNLTRDDLDRHLQTLPRDFNFDFDFAEPWLSVYSPRRLGMTITPLSDQLAAYFGVKQGVLVSEVEAGSSAEAAGLRAGDVITAVKGQAVYSSNDVVRELREAEATVEIRVTRERKELTLSAKLPERTRAFARRGGRAI